MSLSHILIALAREARADETYEQMARMGFFEWLYHIDRSECTQSAARDAAIRMHAFVATAPAIGCFRELLHQASLTPQTPWRRGGARARRAPMILH